VEWARIPRALLSITLDVHDFTRDSSATRILRVLVSISVTLSNLMTFVGTLTVQISPAVALLSNIVEALRSNLHRDTAYPR
jgi:hypothetical protein